mmetsp:Transcript_72577/g.115821  ORF Transcript_72577/g.115821 Transcript_72577/m.115821 type:complete len:502 (-) Transcript_72577:2558-4063(-)
MQSSYNFGGANPAAGPNQNSPNNQPSHAQNNSGGLQQGFAPNNNNNMNMNMHMNNMLMMSSYGGFANNPNMNNMNNMNMMNPQQQYNPMMSPEYALRRAMSSPNVGQIANAALTESATELCYDDTIRLIDGREAEIKFIGTIGYRADVIWYGIALKTQTGNTNGMQQGRAFFTCNPGHGLFVNAHQIACVVKQSNGPRLSYGKRVTCKQGAGVVKFIGLVENKQNSSRRLLYGIDLDKEIRGGHNGNYQNVQYFLARDFHGYFAPEKEISIETQQQKKGKKRKEMVKSPSKEEYKAHRRNQSFKGLWALAAKRNSSADSADNRKSNRSSRKISSTRNSKKNNNRFSGNKTRLMDEEDDGDETDEKLKSGHNRRATSSHQRSKSTPFGPDVDAADDKVKTGSLGLLRKRQGSEKALTPSADSKRPHKYAVKMKMVKKAQEKLPTPTTNTEEEEEEEVVAATIVEEEEEVEAAEDEEAEAEAEEVDTAAMQWWTNTTTQRPRH